MAEIPLLGNIYIWNNSNYINYKYFAHMMVTIYGRLPKGTQVKKGWKPLPYNISVVCTVTKLRTGRSGVKIPGGARDLYLLQNAQTGCRNYTASCEISGFRREVDDKCAFLRCCAACGGNSLQTLWDDLSVPSSMVNLEDENGRLFRNVDGLLTLEDGADRLSWTSVRITATRCAIAQRSAVNLPGR
jgi:hypothetical protein